ncbi:hypothetical protein AVEN_69860-1 [Araneus ventricosus]|uniref:Uncharacterized protein n=1 Tax=Araneus ventricosus TaxID=182803 RepID=A0A4Y2UZP6_ARAVE|nr:hypothetical protein AVEN_69860-1 [Araneus ventricosus]
MTRTTPELAPPSPNFRATPTGGRLATTCDLACNRPHARPIFSGIGFRTCDPPVPTLPLGHRGLSGSVAESRSSIITLKTGSGVESWSLFITRKPAPKHLRSPFSYRETVFKAFS